ncbi:unnamed protein product, partial [Onchocerca ochengi]
GEMMLNTWDGMPIFIGTNQSECRSYLSRLASEETDDVVQRRWIISSALVSFLIAVIIIATGQIMKNDLAASKVGTLIAGGLGSLVFVFLLTALSNFQMFSIGKQVKAGLTDVFVCLSTILCIFIVFIDWNQSNEVYNDGYATSHATAEEKVIEI